METAAGQSRAWNLLEKLGEGDGGEIYRVESLLDRSSAILKRPLHKGFPSDIIRQAGQIEKEAQILAALATRDTSGEMVRVPSIKDKSKPGTEYSDRYFLVLSPAIGLSLAELSRLAHFQSIPANIGAAPPATHPLNSYFIENIVRRGKLPDMLLLRALTSAIDYIESIHTLRVETPTGTIYGVIWNDIKPDHFFWDPIESQFTLIDWGNAQFLESDGITKDRLHSRMGDFQQLLTSLGQFISEVAPDLFQKLDWPINFLPSNAYTTGILPLKERANELLEEHKTILINARHSESEIIQDLNPTLEQIYRLSDIQQEITSSGEIPDYLGVNEFISRLSHRLIDSGDLPHFIELCENAKMMPVKNPQKFTLLRRIAEIAQTGSLAYTTLLSGVEGDWYSALWELQLASLNQNDPAWWDDLSSQIRFMENGGEVLRPFVALNRTIHAIQYTASQTEDRYPYDEVVKTLIDSIVPRWIQTEPDPPDSGIQYTEIEKILGIIAELSPESAKILGQALDQPRSQVNIAIDAWNRQDIEAARHTLRIIFFWDPDRTRLLQADQALRTAKTWFNEVQAGITNDEPLLDFVTRLELIGRDLRNQIAPTPWLDSLLDAFKQLRMGEEPTEVLIQHPDLRNELGWLISLEPRRPLLTSPNTIANLERETRLVTPRPALYGIKEALLGHAKGIILSDPLDTWAPEARGSSARLFSGSLPGSGGQNQSVAIKMMRPDQIDYALPLFREEAGILTIMHDIPGVVSLIETGFIKLDNSILPPEDRNATAENIRGTALRYGLDSTHNFLADLDSRTELGWIPYIAIEKFNRKDNLLLLCDLSYTNGRFFPTLEGLMVAIQICDILDAAHNRNIIYRDHKILHYYWQNELNGVYTIDWNVSKHFPGGLSTSETQFDLVQFGARALHYLLVGRAAPGALPLGPNKPEEIESAAQKYSVQWNYDDLRLPKDIREILHSVLAGEYNSARLLRDDLTVIFQKLSGLVNATGG
jgi:serine/threonine protein kinase